MVDRAAVKDWLDRYVDAWRTYDAEQIQALFSDDATYAYHPWDKGDALVRGAASIAADWREEPDAAGSWDASYEPLVIDGDRAIATGLTRYANSDIFWNMWELDFAPDGRCRRFVEWYMREPKPG